MSTWSRCLAQASCYLPEELRLASGAMTNQHRSQSEGLATSCSSYRYIPSVRLFVQHCDADHRISASLVFLENQVGALAPAAGQEADSIPPSAEGGVSTLAITTSHAGHRGASPHFAGVGKLLCLRSCQSGLRGCSPLEGKEDSAPLSKCL